VAVGHSDSGPRRAQFAARQTMTALEALEGLSPAPATDCGGPLFGLPRITFRALVSSRRGPTGVRVLTPKKAA
jgi:hypothetical protein